MPLQKDRGKKKETGPGGESSSLEKKRSMTVSRGTRHASPIVIGEEGVLKNIDTEEKRKTNDIER